jgi:hypothetical protein
LTESLAPHETGSVAGDGGRRGGKLAAEKPAVAKASQNTLSPADLAPAWRAPVVRKDAKHSA